MVAKKIVFSLITFCTLSATHPEKHLVIVITSFNNAEWYDKNLGTVFSQEYDNYHVIYVDDCSTDGTAELVEQFIANNHQEHRCTLIKNKTRKRALANLYYALQLCKPDDIVFNYDGDDWFAHDHVFELINTLYQDPNIWITYGQFQNWPTGEMGYCQPVSTEVVEKRLYRKKWWKPGQLRTFYAWLFDQVRLKDLLFEGPYFQGQFFPANSDLAIYYPMMEMAGPHFYFIPDVIYIRNVATPINDFKANKEVQILGSKLIREKALYQKLDAPCSDYFAPYEQQTADLFLFSENPELTTHFLSSCQKLVRNIHTVYLFYPIAQQLAYEPLTLQTIPLTKIATSPGTFHEQLLTTLTDSNQPYLLFAHDGMVITHALDCSECIRTLEKTFAYGFYLSLGHTSSISHQTGITQPMPALNQITSTIYAWAFHYADSGDWRTYNNSACTLYRKEQVLTQLTPLTFSNPHELYKAWKEVPINLEAVGLCYQEPKIGYITWY